MKKKLSVGIVIVSYGHEDVLPHLVDLLSGQAQDGDLIVVVDNHPDRKGADSIANNKAISFVVKADNNGFSAGCNIGATKIIEKVDILLFINPDTLPSNNVLNVVRVADYSYYAAVMPLLTLSDKTVNCAGNVVHTSGLSWCDGYGKEAGYYKTNQEISVLSGACMAISADWWKKLDGMSELYFMYYEDTDLSTRILLQGGKMGLFPKAFIEHDYEYEKGTHKWLYLERNRPLYIIRTWPASVIAVLFIQLIFIEVGLWFVAALQHRLRIKLQSFVMTIKALPLAIKGRHAIQQNRTISGYDFLKALKYKLDTPLLGKVGSNPVINFAFLAYYKVCLAILKIFK